MTKNLAQKIIERWPSRAALAADVGRQVVVVHRWYQRGSIPARYFATMLAAAEERGIPVTWRDLLETHRPRDDQYVHGAAAQQPAYSGKPQEGAA